MSRVGCKGLLFAAAGLLLVACAWGCVSCPYRPRDRLLAGASAPWHVFNSHPGWRWRIEWLQAHDPVRMARDQFAAGHVVFAGVSGEVGNVPLGADLSSSDESCYPVIEIEGTGDFIIGDENARFQELATRFASRYNAHLIRLVRAKD